MDATRRAFFHCGVDGIARATPGEAELLPQVGRRPSEGASSMIFGFPMPVVPCRPAAVTQQFFPATAAPAPAQQQATEEQWQCHVPAGCSAAEQWVRSASRKSRRGPRSRSSQYRGVTFYRRTGRWESHIWSVTCAPAVQSFELASFFDGIFGLCKQSPFPVLFHAHLSLSVSLLFHWQGLWEAGVLG